MTKTLSTRRSRLPFALAFIAPLLLGAIAPAAVCLWDRDTLGKEASKSPGVVEAVTGRFERQPARYYEMRLATVAREIEAGATALGLFDDAGVACDRLDRHDEAIAWMAKKRVALDEAAARGATDAHHEYTYLANLGTFHAHRWLKGGASRDDLDDLVRGRDLIAAAIELNPDAHFGRERWQLMALDFLIAPPAPIDAQSSRKIPVTFLPLTDDPWLGRKDLAKNGYADAVEGLVGLITLGNAWESVDVFQALELALIDRGEGHLARLAGLRLAELFANGRTSLVATGPSQWDRRRTDEFIYDARKADIDAFFPEARAQADRWHAARAAYMEERFARGEHPDTHPEFWAAYTDAHPAPKVPSSTHK
jgi:hypothetical protein